MIGTYASYQLITRDIGRSIERIQSQPMVERETAYYRENIGKITSIDEFVNDRRIFNYAMKAFGLSDMAYAKALMVKALEEGVSDPNSFANRMADKRYAEFVRAFNFEGDGELTTVYNPANHGTVALFAQRAELTGMPAELRDLYTGYYRDNIVNVRSIDDLFADDDLYNYALWAYDLQDEGADKNLVRRVLEGGISDPDSLANTMDDDKFRALAAAFDFVRLGEETTTYNPTGQNVVDKYLRQTLEEDAGRTNEGVRLALYFKRKASSITSAFAILADPALAQVVRTALGLPASIAQADVDRQAAMLEKRLDLADFKDPAKVDKFLTRFTSLWEIENPTSAPASVASILISPPAEYGISTDALMALAQLKR